MRIIYSLLMSLVLLNAENFKNIEVIEINEPFFEIEEMYKDNESYVEGVKNACNTQIVQYFQRENIIKFFQNAKEYDSYQAAGYCWYPCRVIGKIKLDSKIYDFELNEGGFAVLKRKNESRYFGDKKLYGECGI